MYIIKDKDGKVVAEAETIEKAVTLMDVCLNTEEELTLCKTED